MDISSAERGLQNKGPKLRSRAINQTFRSRAKYATAALRPCTSSRAAIVIPKRSAVAGD
jgi:hypothetical protein